MSLDEKLLPLAEKLVEKYQAPMLNDQYGNAKILFFDLETSDLKADFGTLLCVGYKFAGDEKTTVISITDDKGWKKDPTDDSKITAKFAKIFNQADMIVTYYGKGFDLKFLNAKMLEHDLAVLPNIPHVDLFYTVKGNLALSRKSLENVAYFLKLNAEKTPVEGRIWKRAQAGNEEAIKYVVAHCEADVELLQEAYMKLRPLVRTHPRVSGSEPCRTCGGNHLQKRGLSLTVHQVRKQRVQCMDCGAWDTRPYSPDGNINPAKADKAL